MKGQGGGGTARGGGKTRSGGGTVKVTKSKDMKTKELEEKIIHLRKALFADNGKDKDVTDGIAPAFLKYDRNGLKAEIKFSHCLSNDEANWAFDTVKDNMEEIYDASGYGWDDEDKYQELTEKGARFLLVREEDKLIAFTHFRFTVQGEFMEQMVGEPSLQIWDIHVDEKYQRKGLGKHLLTLLELIARREKMKMVSVPIQLNDMRSMVWINKVGKGYEPDKSLLSLVGFDAEMEGFEVYSKVLDAPKPKPAAKPEEAVSTPAKKAVVEESPSPVSVAISPPAAPAPVASAAKKTTEGDSEKASFVPVSLEVWQTLTAKSPSSSPNSSQKERKSTDATASAAAPTKLFAGSEETDSEWVIVNNNGSGAEAGKEDELNESGEIVEAAGSEEEKASADLSEPTLVEQDIIAQIRAMYREKQNAEPTAEMEAEWLKAVRETRDQEEGEEGQEQEDEDEDDFEK